MKHEATRFLPVLRTLGSVFHSKFLFHSIAS